MEKEHTLIVTSQEEGRRLDLFLAGKWPGMTRSRAQKLIAQKYVLVNGEWRDKNYRLKEKELVYVKIPPPKPLEAVPQPIPLQIVYEDRYLIVVNKPAGMVVHPAAGHREGTLVNALLAHCPGLMGINDDRIRPGMVHRLDKDTSGLLVVAKEERVVQLLSEQLKKRMVKRIYLALAKGNFQNSKGTIRLYIGRHPKDRKKMAVLEEGRGRIAVTHYKVLKEIKGYSLVWLLLETGRTHQIRVSLSHLGHPVVNDPVYGRREKDLQGKGQLLHAYQLSFVHPCLGKEMTFKAPLPDYFIEKLVKINYFLPSLLEEG